MHCRNKKSHSENSETQYHTRAVKGKRNNFRIKRIWVHDGAASVLKQHQLSYYFPNYMFCGQLCSLLCGSVLISCLESIKETSKSSQNTCVAINIACPWQLIRVLVSENTPWFCNKHIDSLLILPGMLLINLNETLLILRGIVYDTLQ